MTPLWPRRRRRDRLSESSQRTGPVRPTVDLEHLRREPLPPVLKPHVAQRAHRIIRTCVVVLQRLKRGVPLGAHPSGKLSTSSSHGWDASRRPCAMAFQKFPPPAGITTIPGRISPASSSKYGSPYGRLPDQSPSSSTHDRDVRLDCGEHASEVDICICGNPGRGRCPRERSVAVAHLKRTATQLRKLRSQRARFASRRLRATGRASGRLASGIGGLTRRVALW